MSAAAALLSVVHPALTVDEMIETRYLAPDRPARARFYSSAERLIADAMAHRESFNVYFGVNPRRGRDGSANGVTRALVCHADVDAKLWADADEPKAAAWSAIEQFPLRPTAVVDSGGGYQPYWRLTKPHGVETPAERARHERINAALARALCGPDRKPDHVQDVARILRLPGTFNFKPGYPTPRLVELVTCDPERTYDLAGLEAYLAREYPWAGRTVEALNPAPRPRVMPTAALDGNLREKARRGRIRRATLALLDTTGDAGYQSASEADAALAAGLASAGLTVDEAFALIRQSARGEDALRRKGDRHGTDYLWRTVARSAQFVGPVVQVAPGLRVRYGGQAGPRLPMMAEARQ